MMGEAAGTLTRTGRTRPALGFWARVLVVAAGGGLAAGVAWHLATTSPSAAAPTAAPWLAVVVAASYAVFTVQPLLHTGRGRSMAIDAGSVAVMAALAVLTPSLFLASMVVGHAVGWTWHRRDEGMPLVSSIGCRKLVGNVMVNLAYVASALLVFVLVRGAVDVPVVVGAGVAVTVAEAVSILGLAVLVGDRPVEVVRSHVAAVVTSPSPIVVLVIGGLVTTQADDPVATAVWLAAATGMLWLLGRQQVGLREELERHRVLLDVARDLPTRPDRAGVERLLLDRAQAITHASWASLEDRAPTGTSFGVPLDDDVPRWLVVHDRKHDGEAFRSGERETLRGLATLGQLSLRAVALTEDLHHAATHDQLTGLLSRRGLEDRWDGAVARAGRHGRSLGVVYVDLDGFKQVNDRRGHAAGDAVLRATATRLREVARESDLVCRMGGDEFLLVAEEVADDAGLAALVARVREALGPRPGGAAAIPASVGAARLPEDGTELDEVVRVADAAMYRDKQSR